MFSVYTPGTDRALAGKLIVSWPGVLEETVPL